MLTSKRLGQTYSEGLVHTFLLQLLSAHNQIPFFCVLLDVLSSFWLFLFRELILEGTWTPLEEVGVGPDVGITASILKVVFSIDLVSPTFLLH